LSEIVEPTVAMRIAGGVLQALATGTFIYVTFFEILQEEIEPLDTSMGKVASTVAGFVAMSLLLIIPVFL